MSTPTVQNSEPQYVNHYGYPIYSEEPTTGVFSNNSLEYIWDDADQGIDPDYEDSLRRAGEYSEMSGEEYDQDFFDYEYEQSTAYIGMQFTEEGNYVPDPKAEYSAIVSMGSYASMNITQVVASKWLIRGALCSPCCPGQVDADTPGEFLAYSVPPSVVGDADPELRARIFLSPEPVIDANDPSICYRCGGTVTDHSETCSER